MNEQKEGTKSLLPDLHRQQTFRSLTQVLVFFFMVIRRNQHLRCSIKASKEKAADEHGPLVVHWNGGNSRRALPWRKTAFTGHRPKKLPWGYNETDVRCIALKAALERQICSLVQGGMEFLSGMAEGVDLLAAETVLNLRVEYSYIKLH